MLQVHELRKRKLDRIKQAEDFGKQLRYLNIHTDGNEKKRDEIPGKNEKHGNIIIM